MKRNNSLTRMIATDILNMNFFNLLLFTLIIITLIEIFKVNYQVKLLTIKKYQEIKKGVLLQSEEDNLFFKKIITEHSKK
ncbi:hypothetical protein AOQ87_00495 [Candidatus Riesia pediculischaeffi]|uniref:Uncharacterized protein n=2 Tax=Candidatus Riesia pediculischaeffi TaxID=428411 RepID=A0A1V0HKB6_9ENTR|nr:hypothetical protein AOQ87_00495 [Candidatus Riesia pediculischaeffi]